MKIKITLACIALVMTGCRSIVFVESVTHGDYFERPPVKYGTFPFELVYSVNGISHTIRDTVVCKYNGKKVAEGLVIDLWEESFKSGRDKLILKKIEDWGYLSVNTGSCPDYMSYPGQFTYDPYKESGAGSMYITEFDPSNFGHTSEALLSEEKLGIKYGVKIIKWTASAHISQKETQKKS